MGYKLETTALISKWNYNVFRITCIMLILENLNFLMRQNPKNSTKSWAI